MFETPLKYLTCGNSPKAFEEIKYSIEEYDAGPEIYGVCISAEYLENSPGLRKKAVESRDDVNIMLDSGSFQKSGGKFGNCSSNIEWKDVVEMARAIEPEIVVVDDIVGDPEKTLDILWKRSEFLSEFDILAPIQCVDDPSKVRDYVEEAISYGYTSFAIPYHGLKHKSAEYLREVLREIEDLKDFEHLDLSFHVLGCPMDLEVLDVCREHRVDSLDTSSHVRELINSGYSDMDMRARTIAEFVERNRFDYMESFTDLQVSRARV